MLHLRYILKQMVLTNSLPLQIILIIEITGTCLMKMEKDPMNILLQLERNLEYLKCKIQGVHTDL